MERDTAVAKNLRRARADLDITAQEAAEGIGISRNTLRALERAHYAPLPETLEKIAEFYEVPVRRLLGHTEIVVHGTTPFAVMEIEEADRGVACLLKHLERAGAHPEIRRRISDIVYAALGLPEEPQDE